MNVRLLIDGIVRQTTVLVAQLSTSTGVRAPLAHIADQVFLDLAREIEAQGIGRKVVADMFGLALRSYQKKMQRLAESATEKNRTLWQAVLDFLQEGSATRLRILQRFRWDDERDVGAVLNDLVSTGLVYCTGRGDAARYGLTSETDRRAVVGAEELRSVANVAWLDVFRGAAGTREELAERLPVDAAVVERALEALIAEGRLSRAEDGVLTARNVVIPVAATEGWEAAMIDHFRAVATTIAGKVARRDAALQGEEVGGTTLTFSVPAGHPYEAEVRGLLRSVRSRLHALWQEVADYNQRHPVGEDAPKVTFYFGQVVTESDASPADGRDAAGAEDGAPAAGPDVRGEGNNGS